MTLFNLILKSLAIWTNPYLIVYIFVEIHHVILLVYLIGVFNWCDLILFFWCISKKYILYYFHHACKELNLSLVQYFVLQH